MGVINFYKSKKREQDFKNTYEKYYDTILTRISYLTGDLHAAEDLAQEVFMKFYDSPPSHDNIAAWLNKVAANSSYNYLRDRKIHEGKNMAVYENETDKVISIEELAINNCEIGLTRRVLDMLSPRDRMCLLLRFSGYKYSEIAEVIGVDKSSVGTLLSRAQAKFKENYLKVDKWGEQKNEVSK